MNFSSQWWKRTSPLKYKDANGNLVTAENCFQSTGNEDKNGAEIFEGDIVLSDEGMWIGVVIFDGSGFSLKDEEGGYSSFPNWKNCQIIGNVNDGMRIVPKALSQKDKDFIDLNGFSLEEDGITWKSSNCRIVKEAFDKKCDFRNELKTIVIINDLKDAFARIEMTIHCDKFEIPVQRISGKGYDFESAINEAIQKMNLILNKINNF